LKYDSKKAQNNMKSAAEIISFDDTNSNLFEYFGGFSDMRQISLTITDICNSLQEIPEWADDSIVNQTDTRILPSFNSPTSKLRRQSRQCRMISLNINRRQNN